jgi:HK97 family phage major capsid protein
MGNPTFAAKDEGTAVTLFTTDSFIANHDTTFFRAAGGIEVGLNFLQDSVSRVAMDIVNSYSRVAAEWLDEQIAAGDGSTEPQGVIVANGTTDITPTNPTTGALTITDVLNLLFGVSKAYKKHVNGKGKAAFGMTETTYKRLRSIATGLTGDSRLIFGEDVENYMLFGHPVAIEENGLSNADIFFAQLGGYRMYRRQGLKFRRETAGITLAKTNTMYIGADMRYGGQLDRGGYAAVVDAAPA